MNTFSSNFKNLRISKGLTQDQLVSEYNAIFNYSLTKSAISQYENNKRMPEIPALINFAKYFNVNLDYLLALDPITVNEDSGVYNYGFSSNSNIELSNFIENIKESISSQNKLTINGELLGENTISILLNCLDVAVELSKRTQLKEK